MHFYGSSSLQPVLPPLQRHKESCLNHKYTMFGTYPSRQLISALCP
ncbi:hypothetical protein SLEP1_g19825 [Rubroshorea leprosula]|uniref:Uncharacterized protein n=1 Tax=Rubroshorea leprosula TaxID=152421 RepID=A0AAV5J877_9ROSI|nr:hypothetical protein SLEP1_g19825 [Rubroshorea leprosula]